MKKKTLAAASLLLALLMPLGATPLAVYADEAQTGVSTVSEDPEGTGETNKDPEKKDKDNTDENSEEKDKGNTNGGSEADEPESEEKVAATNGVTPPSADILGQGGIWNSRSKSFYKDLKSATEEAQSGDTLYLGEGNYTLYGIKSDGTTRGKDLTFVGSGVDLTAWNIGAEVPDPANYGTEYNSDYSFDGAGTITFENMTLRSGSVDYLGFSRPDKTVVDNCTINGKTFYWGYTSATFTHTTFNAPFGDYALWTYSSTEMTFDQCTFNSTDKVINVYCDFIPDGVDDRTYTINFNSCTVNNSSSLLFPGKQVLNINDSYPAGQHYVINITGDNIITGSKILPPDSITCSRLFGFAGDTGHNAGNTIVNIEDKTVWQDGNRTVDHNGNNFATGSYNNGTSSGSSNQYTDGYKDGKVYKVYGAWTAWTEDANVPHLFRRTRTVNEQCHYCSYNKPLDNETETENAYLLRYDLNGGTGAEGVYSDHYYFKPIGGNIATVAAAPSRAGYQFAGWQDADGKQYAAGDAVTVDHNITLTAQWNKLVTVSFDLCGHGGANISSQTFVSGNKASEPTAPKEDGWVFGGWYTEKGCKYRFSFDSAVTSDITLYAKWDRVTTVVSAPVATPTPSPAPAAAATKTATVKNAAIPQTSDAFPMEGLLALLAVGAVGFGAAGWLRKKHHYAYHSLSHINACPVWMYSRRAGIFYRLFTILSCFAADGVL